MSFEEKVQWVYGTVAIVVPAVYFTHVLSQLGATPVSDIAYQRPLIIAICASIVLNIIGSIIAGIGEGIATVLTGGDTNDVGKKDERDTQIGRRGELVGYYVMSVGVVGALVITMLSYAPFWIANALYGSFVLAAIASAAAKLVAYRRGF